MIFIMARSFKEAIQHRRTHYGIGNNSPISDNEIHEIIKTAVTHVPSAFNSQSTRIVLLLGESHKKLWEIVKDTLRKIVQTVSRFSRSIKFPPIAGSPPTKYHIKPKSVFQLAFQLTLHLVKIGLTDEK